MENSNPEVEIVNPGWQGARIVVELVPPGKLLSIRRPKTAAQLLAMLGLREEGALVARNGQLLTPDRRIWPNDRIFVRPTASAG